MLLPPSNLATLSEKLRSRLDQSMEYFYPVKDRDQIANQKDSLIAKLRDISSLKNYKGDVNQLKTELVNLKSK